METGFLKHYNFYIGVIWVILFIALLMQFTSRAPFGESLLFTFCFAACSFAVSSRISRRLAPKALGSRTLKPFVFQLVLGILFLAFLLALTVELFYCLESTGIFDVSPLISDIHDPFVISISGMLPTAMMVIAGFCGLELFKAHAVQEKERLEDRLKFLKSQVNPHLTFNVLNHIHILMHRNVELADELLLRFSDVLRYQLYECNNDIVLLESELKYVKDIVEIEKMRWGNELEVNANFEIENSAVAIRPLMLIPFIENAFKHVSRLPDKKGYVNITFSQKGKSVRLIVENSKSAMPPRKGNSSGLGLSNTKKRLDISYPEKHSLDIRETDSIYKTDLQITLE